jgi:hypothetical protein
MDISRRRSAAQAPETHSQRVAPRQGRKTRADMLIRGVPASLSGREKSTMPVPVVALRSTTGYIPPPLSGREITLRSSPAKSGRAPDQDSLCGVARSGVPARTRYRRCWTSVVTRRLLSSAPPGRKIYPRFPARNCCPIWSKRQRLIQATKKRRTRRKDFSLRFRFLFALFVS